MGWCKQEGINNCYLVLDPTVVINTLNDKLTKTQITSSWKGSSEIVQIISAADVKISHCYREANQEADFLAKQASSGGNGTFYYSFQQLPKEVKGLFLQDRSHT